MRGHATEQSAAANSELYKCIHGVRAKRVMETGNAVVNELWSERQSEDMQSIGNDKRR